jgi:Multisubunit Na+/H+ antiporter, MnhE subunit
VIEIETALLGTDRYLFSPADFAEITTDYAEEHDLNRIIIDPEYQPGGGAPMLRSFETALAQTDCTVEEAPVDRQTSRSRISTPSTLTKGIATFLVCNVFYLLIAGSITPFNLLTGSVTALAASIAFSNITFTTSPGFIQTGIRVLRMGVFVPYLLWEIAKANLAITYIILHPSLPIDPEMQQFRAGVRGALPVMTLANSITLTPGTLTVDVDDGLYIHTLTESARADLSAGGLERAVRFVFYGRAGARLPAPTERNSIVSITTDPDSESDLNTDIITESSSSQTPQEAD